MTVIDAIEPLQHHLRVVMRRLEAPSDSHAYDLTRCRPRSRINAPNRRIWAQCGAACSRPIVTVRAGHHWELTGRQRTLRDGRRRAMKPVASGSDGPIDVR
jgi:hypothetical protein